jgi:hypothetical protein
MLGAAIAGTPCRHRGTDPLAYVAETDETSLDLRHSDGVHAYEGRPERQEVHVVQQLRLHRPCGARKVIAAGRDGKEI